MPKTVICHYLPQFTFSRLRNGGIFVESGTVTSLNLGLRESHFLIHVEYVNITTREVQIEVIHKKSVVEIKSFFEREEKNIIKYCCKSESEFVLFMKNEKEDSAATYAAKLADDRNQNANVSMILQLVLLNRLSLLLLI
jgi:hypothetical protein